MSGCSELIGLRYRLGADGTNGEIDCIHLVYRALEDMGIATPAFKPAWYGATKWEVARDLLAWGCRVSSPQYDGDVLLLKQQGLAFGVTWQTGILYCNRHLNKVAWSSAQSFTQHHCFRSRSN